MVDRLMPIIFLFQLSKPFYINNSIYFGLETLDSEIDRINIYPSQFLFNSLVKTIQTNKYELKNTRYNAD